MRDPVQEWADGLWREWAKQDRMMRWAAPLAIAGFAAFCGLWLLFVYTLKNDGVL